MKKIYLAIIVLLTCSLGWGQTTVSYDFSASGAVTGLNEDVPGIPVDSNIGFGSFKNSGTSNPGIFSNQLRLYQNATKGGSIKIYANNGVTITSVVVNASGTTGPAGYTIDGGSQTNLTASNTYTINSINATSEVEFFQRDGNSSNRIYVDSFEVTYTSTGGSPILVSDEITISNLDYEIGNGPSTEQSVSVSGSNLDGSDVTVSVPVSSDFELAETASGTYSNSITLASFDGTVTDVFVRLKSGLAINTYADDITVSGGGASDVTVNLSGEVTASGGGCSAIFSDDFSGTLADWSNTADWTISSGELRHNATGSGESYIYSDIGTQDLTTSDYEWEVCIRNGNWDPSSGNDFTYYLLSTNSDVQTSATGYAVGVNRTGTSDLLTLYSVSNGSHTAIITSTFDWDANDDVCIRVTRSSAGAWQLFYDDNGSGEVSGGTTTNTDQTTGQYIGAFFDFTSTRAGLLWFDDVSVCSTSSSSAPSITLSETSISGLDYEIGNGPSTEQSVSVSGSNLDGSDVTVSVPVASDFELAETATGTYSNSTTLASFDGTATDVFVRLKSGFAVNTYADDITISGGGASDVTVSLNGEVTPLGPCLSQLNFTALPTGWDATGVTYANDEAVFGSQNGELATSAISNPTSLTFDLRRTGNTSPKSLIVEVSTTTQDGTYTTVDTYDHNNTTSSGTTPITVDLSAYTSFSNVFIKLRKASSTTSPWYVKNFEVECGTPSTDTEVQFTSASGSVAENGGTFDLVLEIANEDAAATSVEVALTTGSPSDVNSYTTQTVTFPSSSSANQTLTLTITDNMIADGDRDLTFTLQNPSGGNNAQIGVQNTFVLTIIDNDLPTDLPPLATASIPYSEDFSDCATQDWSVFTVGAETEWSCDASGYFEANAFGSSGAADDYLVSPEFDMDAQVNEILSFTSWTRFADATYPPISLLYTDNFTGDPSTTTWTSLSPTWSPENSETSTPSGDIDVSSVSGTSVVFAFRYTSSGTGAGTTAMWRIEDFDILSSANDTSVQFNSASATVNEDDGTVDIDLSITNEDPSSATSVEVVLTSGNASDIDNYTTETITFAAGSSSNETVTVTITDNMIDEADKTLSFTLQNISGGNNAQIGGQSTFDLTILDNDLPPLATASIPYSEDFSDCATQDWSVFTVGAETEWSCDASGYFEANAFGSSGAADDYLVSPEFDMDAQVNEILSFTSWTRFADATYPPISLLYTDNFTGDPSTTTWTSLSPTWSPENSETSTPSGDIDVSSVSGTSVVFAFRYTSSGTGGGTTAMWRIEDFELKENPIAPEPNSHVSDFMAIANGENQIDLSWVDALNNQLPENYLIKISTGSITPPVDGFPETDDLDISDGQGVLNIAQGIEVASFSGLTASTQYFFEIYPYTNSDSDIDYKNDGTVPDTNATTDAVVPVTLGWQITAEDLPFLIDFDNTVSGVNNGQYAGSGFSPSPTEGLLNSETWAVSGFNDGDLNFGDTNTTGDLARGSSVGGSGTGGVYAFETSSGNVSLGVQPGGSDFTPGNITLKVQNSTGATVTDINIQYIIHVFNDQNRSTSFNFSYSTDDVVYTNIPELDYSTTEVADDLVVWENNSNSTLITGLSIANQDFIYLRWESDDVSGSGSRDELAIDDIGVTFNPTLDDYVYSGGVWTPSNPVGSSTLSNDIQILDGTAIINGSLLGRNLSVSSGASLEMAGSSVFLGPNGLQLSENIINDGTIIFKSNENGFSQLNEFNGSISGSGDVIVENFIAAGTNNRRAFRFVTSAVTTSNSIKMNWQEGVNNPDVSTNLNPNSGFGTHISGSKTASNGFDATLSGNPSLFVFNDSTQLWVPIDNTDINTLDAGNAFLLFIRGDRSINLNNNSTMPTNTTIRSKGELLTGSLTTGVELPDLAQGDGMFSFLGNPYQSILDFNSLNFIGDVNSNFLYIWDANASTQGVYVTLDNLSLRNLLPGQSFFVVNSSTVSSSPAIEFNENNKVKTLKTLSPLKSKEQSIEIAKATLELYNNNDIRVDVLKFRFEQGADNGIDDFDAPKFSNITENLASSNNNTLLTVERRDIPSSSDIIPLFINQYQVNKYKFRLNVSDWISGLDVYIVDNYLNNKTLISDGQVYEFSLDSSIPESISSSRFSLSFENTTLSVGESNFGAGFVLYPNPSINGSYVVKTDGLSGKDVQVRMHNILGQKVLSDTFKVESNGDVKVDAGYLPSGVYTVQLSQNTSYFNSKLIIK